MCLIRMLLGLVANASVSLYWRAHGATGHRMSSLTVTEREKKQSFKLQERGTALKNKGDRCQYINFMRMKKKKSTN